MAMVASGVLVFSTISVAPWASTEASDTLGVPTALAA